MMRTEIEAILRREDGVATPEALARAEPALQALGVQLQRNSAGVVRGRLYLPAVGGARVVDVVEQWDQPWTWIERGLDPTIVLPPPPVTPPPEPPPPPAPAVDLTPVLEALADLQAQIGAIDGRLSAIARRLELASPPWTLRATLDLWGAKRGITGTIEEA